VRLAHRDEILGDLKAQGVGAGVHYPIPLHLQPVFAPTSPKAGAFPEAERAAATVLSLPLFPGITEEQQVRVAEVLAKAVAAHS
jgi:dTDP-4-amino-4,6-dideoxygalactose transaminase